MDAPSGFRPVACRLLGALGARRHHIGQSSGFLRSSHLHRWKARSRCCPCPKSSSVENEVCPLHGVRAIAPFFYGGLPAYQCIQCGYTNQLHCNKNEEKWGKYFLWVGNPLQIQPCHFSTARSSSNPCRVHGGLSNFARALVKSFSHWHRGVASPDHLEAAHMSASLRGHRRRNSNSVESGPATALSPPKKNSCSQVNDGFCIGLSQSSESISSGINETLSPSGFDLVGSYLFLSSIVDGKDL